MVTKVTEHIPEQTEHPSSDALWVVESNEEFCFVWLLNKVDAQKKKIKSGKFEEKLKIPNNQKLDVDHFIIKVTQNGWKFGLKLFNFRCNF